MYFVLWVGSAIPGRLRSVGQKNDISYGVYLYAFPVQQTLAYAGLYKLGPIPMILGAAAIVLGLSWLSWRFVESPAMSLKSWGPGRGFAYWVRRFRPRGRHDGKDQQEGKDQEGQHEQVARQQEAHSQSLLGTSSAVAGGQRLDAYRKRVVKRHHPRPSLATSRSLSILREHRW